MLATIRGYLYRLSRWCMGIKSDPVTSKHDADIIITMIDWCHLPNEITEIIREHIDLHIFIHNDREQRDRMCAAAARKLTEFEMERQGFYPVPGIDVAWEVDV